MTVDRASLNGSMSRARASKSEAFAGRPDRDQSVLPDRRAVKARDEAAKHMLQSLGQPRNWSEARVGPGLIRQRDDLDARVMAGAILVERIPDPWWPHVDWGQNDEDHVRDLVNIIDDYMRWRATGKTHYVEPTDPSRIIEAYINDLAIAVSYVLRRFDDRDSAVELDAATDARVRAILDTERLHPS